MHDSENRKKHNNYIVALTENNVPAPTEIFICSSDPPVISITLVRV